MARGRYGHMIKSLIVIGDFFCLNIAYAVVCYWGGGFDGGFGVKIIWLLLNLSYFPVFSLFAKIHELRILHVDRVLIKVTQAVLCHLAVFLLLIFFLQIDNIGARVLLRFYLLLVLYMCLMVLGYYLSFFLFCFLLCISLFFVHKMYSNYYMLDIFLTILVIHFHIHYIQILFLLLPFFHHSYLIFSF